MCTCLFGLKRFTARNTHAIGLLDICQVSLAVFSPSYLPFLQEVPVKHVVVNKVVEESVQEGYVQRLAKGQAAGVEQLEQVRASTLRQ